MPITGLFFQKECPSALLFEAIGLKWKKVVLSCWTSPQEKRPLSAPGMCVKAAWNFAV